MYSLYEKPELKEQFIQKHGKTKGEELFAVANSLYLMARNSTVYDVKGDELLVISAFNHNPVIDEIIKTYPEVADFVKGFCLDMGIVPEQYRDITNAQEAGYSVKEHQKALENGYSHKLEYPEENTTTL